MENNTELIHSVEPVPGLKSQLKDMLHRVARPALFAGRVALVAGIGLMAASSLGDSEVTTEHATFELHTQLTPDFSGGLEGKITGGSATYPTHSGPLGLEVTIADTSVQSAIDLVTKASVSTSLRQESAQLNDAARQHTEKSLAIIGITSALMWTVTSERSRKLSKRTVGSGLLAATLAMGVPVSIGAVTHDNNAFNKPTYSGVLAYGLKNKDAIKLLDGKDQDVANQAKYLFKLLDSIEKQASGEEEKTSLKALLVSDIHSRNVYPLIKMIVENYGINFVIDSGDIVDWGKVFENGFFLGPKRSLWRGNSMGIEQLDVPYLMAPGNHDSSGTVEALRTIPNVIILENGQKFTQNGLTITGKADPVFSPDNGLSKESEKSEEKQLGRDMQGILDEQAANIVVLHNPTAGNEVKTGSDLVISGHTHKFKFREGNPDEPLRITAGTSGGAGLRMFDNPYGVETQQDFSILNFSSSCRLISIDQISVTSVSGPPNLRIKHIPVSNSKISTVDQTQSCQ